MAEADDSQKPIVIKRKKAGGHGHHGGAWKIAYADFVTAMMAFFLLMWLLGSTSKGDLQGIADYFKNPMRVSMRGGSGSGSSSSIINGGGTDLSRRISEVKEGEVKAERKSISLKAAQAELERLEIARLQELKRTIESTIERSPELNAFKDQLLLDITSEGLRIQIVDEKNRPMFERGSARLVPYTKTILRAIGGVLNDVPNRVSLAGHTDATQYVYGERAYSNWELSSDRANASRREMVGGGLDNGKVIRVVGLASSVLFNLNDPYDAQNRRISVVVLNRNTEKAILNDGVMPVVEIGGGASMSSDMLQSGSAPEVPSQLQLERIPEPSALSGSGSDHAAVLPSGAYDVNPQVHDTLQSGAHQ